MHFLTGCANILWQSRDCKHIRVWRSLVSRLNGVQEASSSNLDTRTKKAERVFTLSAFFFYDERFEKFNATVRWTVARDGLTERNNNFCHRQKCKRISTLGPKYHYEYNKPPNLYGLGGFELFTFRIQKFSSFRHNMHRAAFGLHHHNASLYRRQNRYLLQDSWGAWIGSC